MISTANHAGLALASVESFEVDNVLLSAVGLALGLIERSKTRTLSLTLSATGAIELPDAAPVLADDQAVIRAAATLYLASQLEHAGLVTAVETISGLAIGGSILNNASSLIEPLGKFWQGRNERFREEERRAYFSRLFGAETMEELDHPPRGVNDGFEESMIGLCESLYKLDEIPSGDANMAAAPVARIRPRARFVVSNLLRRGTGFAAFAAEEIITTIRACIQILQIPQIKLEFGAASLWEVVASVNERYRHVDIDVQNYVRRGKAGLEVLSWLADILPVLTFGGVIDLSLTHPVIVASEAWLASSLAIREAMSGVAK